MRELTLINALGALERIRVRLPWRRMEAADVQRSEEAVLNLRPMIRIAVTEAAFHAVAALPLGRVVYEPRLNAQGERLIWVERIALDKLDAMRGADESYSDVILRLVELESRVRS